MMVDSEKKKASKPSRMPFGISSIKDKDKDRQDETPTEPDEKEETATVKKRDKKGDKQKDEKKKPKAELKPEMGLKKPEHRIDAIVNRDKKKLKGKMATEPIVLWLRIEDWDPVPYETDPSISVHDMKLRIKDDPEFELYFAKTHKMKCYLADGTTLDPRLEIGEQLDEGQEVIIKLLGSLQPDPSIMNSPISSPDYLSTSMLAHGRDHPTSPSRPPSATGIPTPISPFSTPMQRERGGTNHDLEEKVVKNSLANLAKRLDDMDEHIAKKNEAFDESVKQLSELADRLKRMNGIPAVGNDIRGGPGPGMKSKDMIGHDGPVWTLSYGSQNLFSGSSDTTVKVWDPNTLRVKHTLRGHTSIVHCVVAFNKDKTVVSGSDDKTIKIWDVENQVCKNTIRDDNIACVLRAHRGHLFSGSFKYVKVWSLTDHSLVGVLPGHNHWVRAVTLANGYCFSGGHNVIKVWDMAKFNCVRTMTQPCGSIYALLVNGNMLYAGTYENTVNIWDLRTYEFVRSLPGHTGAVYSLALHQNKLFSGSYDTTIRVWDLTSFQCVQRLTGHSSSVEALATSKDRLFSASTDQTIKSWRFPDEAS